MEDWEGVADRHGLIRTADALQAGLTGRQLARLVRDGDLVRLGRGWYSLPLVAASEDEDSAWARRRTLHAAQATAAWSPTRAVPWRATTAPWCSEACPLSAPTCVRSTSLDRGHVVAASSRPDPPPDGARRGCTDGVIDLAVAVVQAGCLNGSMAALVAADAALHRGLLDPTTCDVVAIWWSGPRPRWCARYFDMPTAPRSLPGETRLRHALRVMGFGHATDADR